MPATAGRVRTPWNNRVHSSAALQTHSIWQSAIHYDPYAPSQDDTKGASQSKTEDEPENLYVNFQGLLARARITGSNTDEARGACKKCGRVGHLPFQCRNFVSVKDDKNEKDLDAIQANVMAELGKIKGSFGKRNNKSGAEIAEESSEDESESSDSSEDSEMERIIAQRFRKKKGSSKSKSLNKKKDLSDDEDSEPEKRKRRGRPKKRSGGKRSESVSDDDDARRKREEKRRKRDESSDEEEHCRHRRKSRKEKRRRRGHRHSDDSEDSEESPRQDKRKSRRGRSPSDSEVSYLDDSEVRSPFKYSDSNCLHRAVYSEFLFCLVSTLVLRMGSTFNS